MDLIDIAIGFIAFIAVFPLSLFTGGFSFFTPWIMWGAILLSVAGFSRPPFREEAFWRRVLSINMCSLIFMAALLRSTWWGFALVVSGLFVATSAGVFARRMLDRASD